MKAAEAIAASLNRLYGSEVEVRYHDISVPSIRNAHADILEEIRRERAPFPIVLVNGELLYAGTINPLRVVGAIATQIVRQRGQGDSDARYP